MTYTIHGKNGVTPAHLRQVYSHSELMEQIAGFIAFNPPKTPLTDDTAKIKYYSRDSFYMVMEHK